MSTHLDWLGSNELRLFTPAPAMAADLVGAFRLMRKRPAAAAVAPADLADAIRHLRKRPAAAAAAAAALVLPQAEVDLVGGAFRHRREQQHRTVATGGGFVRGVISGGLGSNSRRSFEDLPDECLYEILRRLPDRRDRAAALCVSRRWLTQLASVGAAGTVLACSLPDLNEAPDDLDLSAHGVSRTFEGDMATDVRVAAAAVAAANMHGGLTSLVIRGGHSIRGVSDFALSAIAKACPELEALTLCDVQLISDTGLIEIAQGCPLLKKLDISHCPRISDKGLIAIAESCPNLAALDMESCHGIGNEGLRAVGRCCPKLKFLGIKNCYNVRDKGIASLVCFASSSLERIHLKGLHISDVTIAVIGYYGKAVTDLTLSRLNTVREKGFWVMANASGLQKLNMLRLSACPGITDLALASLAKCCMSLKQLLLWKCPNVSDTGLESFMSSAKEIESLHIKECGGISLCGVLAGLIRCNPKFSDLSLVKCGGIRDVMTCPPQLPLCRSLRSLTVSGCPGFTDASLAVVGKICPLLEKIDLSGLSEVTDNGLLPLIDTSEGSFTTVNLRGCAKLSDAAIAALISAHGKTLRVLNLDGCSNVTDSSLLAISESCNVLGELDLSGCMVSDSGIAHLSSATQMNLQLLSLSRCWNVTRASVALLGNMGQSLRGLNLRFCTKIGNTGISALEQKLWWCDILA